MAQDVVGGRDMKKELRHSEGQQQRLSVEGPRRAVLEGKDHLLFLGAIYLRCRDTRDELSRNENASLEFGNAGLDFRKRGRFNPGKQRASGHRVPDGFADLANEVIHVGVKSGVEQDGGIDIAGFGMSRRTTHQIRQIAKKWHKNTDRRLIERDSHDFDFSGWHGAAIWSKCRTKSAT